MADETGPVTVAEDVAVEATPEPPTPEPSTEKPKPLVIFSQEELEATAARAASVEGRLELAEPVWVACWKCHLMVAPARGLKMYERIFGNELFARDLTGDDANVDTAFLKELVVNCVVQPQMTDALVDKLLETNAKDFVLLASACMVITQKDAETEFSDILGVVDTETRERFTAGQDGSTSTPMRA